MTLDPLDSFVREAIAPVDVSDERLRAVMNATLQAVDRCVVPARPSLRQRMIHFWTAPLWRYAAPMTTAVILGLVVGASIPATPTVASNDAGHVLIVSFATTLAGF